MTTDATPAVLFVCVHNAGRSQMAAGFLREIAGDADSFFLGAERSETTEPTGVVEGERQDVGHAGEHESVALGVEARCAVLESEEADGAAA